MFESSALTMPANDVRQQLVAELQQERSQVWGLYCQIAEMKPLFASAEIRPVLANFLQILIDYVSLGHFGMYEHLAQSGRLDQFSYAGRIYPRFSRTTASAIRFSERYDSFHRQLRSEHLAEDLSVLGENLAERMEMEDRLCSMLLH